MNKNNWKKTFFTIYSGQAISQFTSAVVQMSLIWYLTAQSKSAAILAIATLAGFLPQAILGPFIGVLVDRFDRKKIMIISDAIIALVALVLAIGGLGQSLPLWMIIAGLFVRSVGTAFHQPSLQAVTPLIVPEEMLTKCAGYSQTLTSVSFILSPVLAGTLYVILPISAIIGIDILGAIAGIITLLMVMIPKVENQSTEKVSLIKESIEGFKVLKNVKGMLEILFIGALFSVVFLPIASLFPLMSLDYFNGTSAHAAVVETLFAVGMLVGSLILGKWGGFKNKIHSMFLAYMGLGLTLAISGIFKPSQFIGFAIMSGLMGLSAPLYNGPFMALLQTKIEPQYLGRVFSLSGSLMSLASPIGLGLAGIFADKVGINHWFFISGILILFIGCLNLIIPAVRNIDK